MCGLLVSDGTVFINPARDIYIYIYIYILITNEDRKQENSFLSIHLYFDHIQ